MFVKKIVKQSIGNRLFSATWITAKNKPRTILLIDWIYNHLR